MTEPISMNQALIRKLTDITKANISNEHFGVEELAKEAGISRITLYRKIKSIKNQDASQFIRELRLRYSMELLRKNAGTVTEVAFMVGFTDPAYFNKCFHDFFGFPRASLRKKQQTLIKFHSRMKQIIHPDRTEKRGGHTSVRYQCFWHLLFYYYWVILYHLEIPVTMKAPL